MIKYYYLCIINKITYIIKYHNHIGLEKKQILNRTKPVKNE